MDGTGSKTPPPQGRVNGVVPNVHTADTEQVSGHIESQFGSKILIGY